MGVREWADELGQMAARAEEDRVGVFARERLVSIGEIARQMRESGGEEPAGELSAPVLLDLSLTAKVGTRSAVFSGGRILLVHERGGRWTLPGGWCEADLDPRENAVKETREEAGALVRPLGLLEVSFAAGSTQGREPFDIVRLVYLCELQEMAFVPGDETDAARWFSEEELPPLVEEKCSAEQIHRYFSMRRKDETFPILSLPEAEDGAGESAQKESDREQWIAWGRSLEAIASAGLCYDREPWLQDCWHRVREIAADLVAAAADLPRERVLESFASDVGYSTPAVDVRGICVREGRIGLILQESGRWVLPGGWCRQGCSPQESLLADLDRQTGETSRVGELLALHRHRRGTEAGYLRDVLQLVFLCELPPQGGDGERTPAEQEVEERSQDQGQECTEPGIRFFSLEELPPLEASLCTAQELREDLWQLIGTDG